MPLSFFISLLCVHMCKSGGNWYVADMPCIFASCVQSVSFEIFRKRSSLLLLKCCFQMPVSSVYQIVPQEGAAAETASCPPTNRPPGCYVLSVGDCITTGKSGLPPFLFLAHSQHSGYKVRFFLAQIQKTKLLLDRDHEVIWKGQYRQHSGLVHKPAGLATTF